MPEDLMLGAMRGLHWAALSLSADGLLHWLGATPARRVQQVLLGLALLSGLGRLGLRAAKRGSLPAAQWLLISQTGFGRWMALRLGQLALTPLVRRGWCWQLSRRNPCWAMAWRRSGGWPWPGRVMR